MLRAIESLIMRFESADGQEPAAPGQVPAVVLGDRRSVRRRRDVEVSRPAAALSDPCLVHTFDTERRDLQRCGHVLELRERKGSLLVVVAPSGSHDGVDMTRRAEAQIDSSWALEILSGALSPLAALERRLGRPGPCLVENVRAMVGGRKLQRIDSRMAGHAGTEGPERPDTRPSLQPSARLTG